MKEGLSPARIARCLEKLPSHFSPTRSLLIPVLQFVQGELGYLPTRAMQGIAEYLGIPESEVYGVATFYAQFRFTPIGKNIITICRGTACHVRGSAKIQEDLERHLGIEPFQTTPDMLFTMEAIACFGSCALAPVVVVNKKVYGWQTSASVIKMVDQIYQSEGKGTKAGKGKQQSKKQTASGEKSKSKRAARTKQEGVA